MTRNQIEYWKYREGQRNNLVTEAETERNNRAVLAETNRANLAREGENYRTNKANEDIRREANVINANHYARMDAETNRANLAREQETNRANRAAESIGRTNAYANVLGSQASLSQAAAQHRNATINEQMLPINTQKAQTEAYNAQTNRMNANTNQRNATTNFLKLGPESTNELDWESWMSRDRTSRGQAAKDTSQAARNYVGVITDVGKAFGSALDIVKAIL